MESRFNDSWIRLFALSALLWFSLPLFAADRNFTDADDTFYQNSCERLLEADLSGYFVATNLDKKTSQLIQLRRLGATSAYTVSRAFFELAPSGVRELEFVRSPDGWKLGDPGKPNAQVNLVTILRERGKIFWRFENASDHLGFAYDATPAEDKLEIQGDILHPDEWILRFESAFSAEIRFTRVKLDRSFELAVSQPLKSLLANRLDDGEPGSGDYTIMVQFKQPLTLEAAQSVLGTENIFPLDEASNAPYYRYAVPKNIFGLLESIGQWTSNRHVIIAHIDAVPSRLFDLNTIRSRMARAPAVQRTLDQMPHRPPLPAATAEQQERPGLSRDAIAELRNLGAGLGGGAGTPRDLDSDHGHDQDQDHAEDDDHDHRQ